MVRVSTVYTTKPHQDPHAPRYARQLYRSTCAKRATFREAVGEERGGVENAKYKGLSGVSCSSTLRARDTKLRTDLLPFFILPAPSSLCRHRVRSGLLLFGRANGFPGASSATAECCWHGGTSYGRRGDRGGRRGGMYNHVAAKKNSIYFYYY